MHIHILENYCDRLWRDRKSAFIVYPDGQIGEWGSVSKNLSHMALISGSFNPLHNGHIALYHAAENAHWYPLFELSIHNRDKGGMSSHDLNSRLAKFRWKYPVLVTFSPRFKDKIADLGITAEQRISFVLGADTYQRLVRDDKKDIANYPVRFLVADRILNGTRISLHEPDAPANVIRMRDHNLVEISSTNIRNGLN